MNITELISMLERIKSEHGDIDCFNDEYGEKYEEAHLFVSMEGTNEDKPYEGHGLYL